MNERISYRQLAALVALASLVCIIFGCGTGTPAKQVAQSAQSIAESVKAAMNTAGDAYRAGLISDAEWDTKITPAYEKYQSIATSLAAAEKVYIASRSGDLEAMRVELNNAALNLFTVLAKFSSRFRADSPKADVTPRSGVIYTDGCNTMKYLSGQVVEQTALHCSGVVRHGWTPTVPQPEGGV